MKFVYRIKQLMLAGGDMLAFVFGFWLSLTVRNLKAPNWNQIEQHLTLFFLLFLLWIVVNFINNQYDLNQLKDKQTHRYFLEAALLSFFLSIIFFYILPQAKIAPKTILLLNVIFGYGFSYVWRILYNRFIGLKKLYNNIIFLGCTEETRELISTIQNNPESGHRIAAMIDPEKKVKPAEFPFFDIYHSLQTVRPAISNHQAHMIIIAPHLRQDEEALRELYELLFWNVRILDLTSFYEAITGRIPPATFSESYFLENLKNVNQPVYEKIRTAIDYIAGLVLGAVFVALLPLIALGIKLSSPGPIFYKQKRMGINGQSFFLYKFRSMYALSQDGSAETGEAQFASKEDKRVTKVGKFLRKTRLDELPQVLNILKRDITLIGPRPERPEIVKRLEEKMPYYSLRHIVRPGLTGWAVLHQNYTDNLEKSLQKLQYDLYYIKNRSFWLDLSIMLRTVNVILRMMGQ